MEKISATAITAPSGATNVAYTYDHDGLRIGTTVNGTDVTRYLVDKNRPYAQVLEEQRRVGGFETTTSYVYGNALLSQSTGGIPHYYLYDGLGSARGLTDSAGTLTDAYRYDAYGNWLDKSGSTSNAYGYRGEQYDEALDEYYLRARYYQPGIGRFVTTDPVEGFPTTPMSLHRYVYGNANPLANIDPSGEVNIHEAIITGGIILNLGAIAAGTFTEMGQQAYADLGEYIFPDAFILGINGSVTLLRALATIALPFMNIYNFPLFYGAKNSPWDLNYGVGGEILFSVTSGEISAFFTHTKGLELGYGMSPFSAEVYQGYVWNLWNAKNYEGPFDVFSVNIPVMGTALFWDAKNSFYRGPWGASQSIVNFPNKLKISMAYNMTKYRMLTQFDYNLPNEGAVVGTILPVIYATNTLAKFVKSKMSPSQSLPIWTLTYELAFDTTIWLQTGIAKYFWNNSPGGYPIETRQQSRREDFPDFRSGPTLFSAGQFM